MHTHCSIVYLHPACEIDSKEIEPVFFFLFETNCPNVSAILLEHFEPSPQRPFLLNGHSVSWTSSKFSP